MVLLQHPDYPSTDEVLDMKENEQMELYNLCKSSFEAEKNTFNKRKYCLHFPKYFNKLFYIF